MLRFFFEESGFTSIKGEESMFDLYIVFLTLLKHH